MSLDNPYLNKKIMDLGVGLSENLTKYLKWKNWMHYLINNETIKVYINKLNKT